MNHALYFKALNRQFYVMGIDRQLFFLLLGLCVPLAYSGHFALDINIIAVVLFTFGYIAAVFITRADAKFLPIYLRHIKYKSYYAPYPGIHAPIRLIKPSVPIYQGQRGFV